MSDTELSPPRCREPDLTELPVGNSCACQPWQEHFVWVWCWPRKDYTSLLPPERITHAIPPWNEQVCGAKCQLTHPGPSLCCPLLQTTPIYRRSPPVRIAQHSRKCFFFRRQNDLSKWLMCYVMYFYKQRYAVSKISGRKEKTIKSSVENFLALQANINCESILIEQKEFSLNKHHLHKELP